MATSADIEDELSCPICMELLKDPNTPKNLPCGHVCCEVCLGKMVAGNTENSCSECRQTIRIPSDGVSEFPTNFRLRNLAEKHLEAPEPVQKSGVPICPDHEEERMHLFCTPCNVMACNTCVTLKHRGDEHDIVGYKEVYVRQKEDMQNAIATVSNSIADGEKVIEILDKLRGSVNKSHEAIEQQIDECFESNVKKLNEERQKLKKELQQAKEAKLAKVDQKFANTKEEVSWAKYKCDAATSVVTSVPDYRYITQHSMLIDAMNQIDLNDNDAIGITPFAAAQFTPRTMNMDIGCITPVEPERPREVKLVQTLDGLEGASDAAHSATGLLAVCDYYNSQVIIYEKVSDRYQRKLNMKLDPSNEYIPRGVAIHPDGRFMVAGQSSIEVYSPDGNYLDKIQTAAPGTDTNVFSITATSDGRILSGDIARSVITEHDATGNIMRTMWTNSKPVYMTLIHDSHIAMSDGEAGKVSVMDMETEQETLSIDIPLVTGICYDEQTECMLMARNELADEPGMMLLNTGVIEQYSYTTGKLVACLQQGLYRPVGMSLTTDGKLIVANMKDVKIYELK